MDVPEQDEADAQMRAMMGFSSFGMQPGAKRQKTEQHPTSHGQPLTHQFGPPSHPSQQTQAQAQAQGQNPAIGSTGPPNTIAEATPQGEKSQATPTDLETPKSAFPTGVPMGIFDKLTWKELEAYRKGVKDENGDLVWFLPSFIEDPWAKLEKQINDQAAGAGPGGGNAIS